MDEYIEITGTENKYHEPYLRGDQVISKISGEEYFYTTYELIRHSRSAHIEAFFLK